MNKIPYYKPFLTGDELPLIREALGSPKWSGNGAFTKKCHAWLSEKIGCEKAFLTQSATSALEMAALLADLKPGDEVIMPSFTFVSTANAFVLRRAVPVFVDIRPDTLNINENLIESAITARTKAIAPIHYAGVACEMESIMAIAQAHNLTVIADAAQGIGANYKNKPLASWGHLSALSFHDTKNVISGEGGALIINDKRFLERAEILWEKGTNRSQFLRGEVDKYTWVDVGSSFLPSEITASILFAQLQKAQAITESRMQIWQDYYKRTLELELLGFVKRPQIPAHVIHNAHIFYLILDPRVPRTQLIRYLAEHGIEASSHYVPLHSSPAGTRFARSHGDLTHTTSLAERILRLPLWPGLQEAERVVSKIKEFCLQTEKSWNSN